MKYSPESQFCIWLSLLSLTESYLIYSKRGKGKIAENKDDSFLVSAFIHYIAKPLRFEGVIKI